MLLGSDGIIIASGKPATKGRAMKRWTLRKLNRSTPVENEDEKGLACRDSAPDGRPRYKSNWHLHNLLRAASGKGAGAGMSREAIIRSCERIERENPGVYTEMIAFIHRVLDRREEEMMEMEMEVPVIFITYRDDEATPASETSCLPEGHACLPEGRGRSET